MEANKQGIELVVASLKLVTDTHTLTLDPFVEGRESSEEELNVLAENSWRGMKGVVVLYIGAKLARWESLGCLLPMAIHVRIKVIIE